MLIDTHCHINFAQEFPDPDAAVDEAVAAGVGTMIAVGCDLETSRRAVELAERRPEVLAIVGLHPNYTSDFEASCLRAFEPLIDHPRTVALGEIGLDYFRDYSQRECQKKALMAQLELAHGRGMRLVFHCREAYDDLLTILENETVNRPFLFHCFSGGLEDARRAMTLDSYFGVDGPITYKSADALRELVRALPRNRLVIETDSPYMTPVPHRGKANRPAYLRYVNAGLAACLGLGNSDCAELTERNAREFFRI